MSLIMGFGDNFPVQMVACAQLADGRAHHDTLPALYRDRTRANGLELLGWTVLRFTWADLKRPPGWVVAQVRQAIATA